MSWPARALAAFVALLVAFGAGWATHVCYRAGVDARDALAQAETNRESERLVARARGKVADELANRLVAAERSGRDMRERMRVAAAASSAALAASCPAAQTAAPIGLVSDGGRERLAAAIDRAEEVAEQLRAWQALAPLLQNCMPASPVKN